MTKDARFLSAVMILSIFALWFAAPAAAAVSTPKLVWAYGGCYSSGCETGWYSSPAVADLDGDGNMEVIASAYSIVVLDAATGALKWRVSSGHDRKKPNAANVGRTWAGIVIADLDHDGQPEIVTAHSHGWVSVLNKDGYFKSKGWPWRDPGGLELRSLSVGDLDRDGNLEIVVGRAAGSGTNTWVLENTGAVRWGWPRLRSGDRSSAWGTYNANIGLGDLDGDGFPEIIVPSDTLTVSAYRSDGTQLATNVIYHDQPGQDMNFWGEVPAYVDQRYEIQGWGPCSDGFTPRANFAMGPANVVDVNGDGVKEVVVIGNVHDCSTHPYTDLYNTPFIFNADRSRFKAGGFDWTTVPTDTGAPLTEDWNVIESAQPNPVTVDLDGDGNAEILFASYDGKMHCFWLDKTEKGNWPYSVYNENEKFYRFASEPVVADLDNDWHAEVIFTSWTQKGSHATGKLHILDYLGNVLQEVDLPPPRGDEDWNGGLAAPTLARLNAGGDLYLFANTANSGVVAYDLPGTSNARVLWGTGRGSYLREGGNGELPSVVAGPDLAPSWQRLTVTGPDKKGHYNAHGWIKVSNLGNQASAAACLLDVYYPDESQTILKKPITVGKLPAGRAVVKEFMVKGLSLAKGASRMTAVADTGNSVAEINENNNKAVYIINLP